VDLKSGLTRAVVFGGSGPIKEDLLYYISDLRQISGFLWVLRFPPPIKLNAIDITEIFLKGALNTIISPFSPQERLPLL
jgi:hypothetical protein